MNIADSVNKILTNIFGSSNERTLRKLWPIVDKINELEPEMMKLPDREFLELTKKFKERLKQGETLDDILPEAFAAVREASRRTTGMRHFDVQLIGGIVLHQGKISEMATGEGKTLVATCPAYLNALTGDGVHIVTVNDYLAKRDTQWMGPIYDFLGLTSACIQGTGAVAEAFIYDKTFKSESDEKWHCLRPITKKEAYQADVTYGTNNEFGFDYLRDNMKITLEDQVQSRGLNFAIVDEVDSILIDEARTPLIISGPAEESPDKYYQADAAAKMLKKGEDYTVKEKEHIIAFTENGFKKAERMLGVDSFFEGDNLEWPHLLEQAVKARELYKNEKDYIVKDGEVIIVDEFTGRLMPGRRWSDGLHQAVEAKEGLSIREENQTLATITLQNYFRLYKKISGMTGTAATEAGEFSNIYKLDVVVIPTNKQLIRTTFPDTIYRTKKEKYDAIVDEIVNIHNQGRPILVGTTSIENSELISDMLKRRGVKHEVLNAKHHEKEAYIVAKAGQRGAVTIATNMAGRGTDIILGEGVAKNGGLHILGTERHEARRIDNQLRGRAGRQGDPGSSRFILSLEDDLLRIFAPEWVSGILKTLGMDEGVPIESRMISNSIERAQKKVESHNFDIRKSLLEYDYVMDLQRKYIYSLRQKILKGENLKDKVIEMLENRIYYGIDTFLPDKVSEEEWDFDGLVKYFHKKVGVHLDYQVLKGKTIKDIEEILISEMKKKYDEHEAVLGAELMRVAEKMILLDSIDTKWKEHLYNMDHLRAGIGLRGYAQLDPKIEYKKEGTRLFQEMLSQIEERITEFILKIKAAKKTEEKASRRWRATNYVKQDYSTYANVKKTTEGKEEEEKPKPFVATAKPGRNAPCPCGSGKKYKKCCGK